MKTLDSRALPDLSWEDGSAALRAARQMVSAWMAQLANHKLGRELCYCDLDLVSLFNTQLLAKFALPALTTCAQLEVAVDTGLERILLRDDHSVYCQTVRAYALAHDIPLTIKMDWSGALHPRSWAERIAIMHHLLQLSQTMRIRWQNRSLPKVTNAGLDILALLAPGVYVASALPVLKLLRHSLKISIVPLDHTVDRYLAQQGWPCLIPSDHILGSESSIVREAQRELRQIGHKLLQWADLFKPFHVGPVDLTPVAQPIIQTLLHVRLPMAVPVVEGLQAIIQRQRPQIILTVPDQRWRAKAAIELGRRAHIPSLTIQAAVISSHPRYDRIVADRVAVIGDSSRRLWAEQGVPSEKLVVTGSPRFDDKYQLDPQAAGRVRGILGIPLDRPIITFATQPLSPTIIEQNVCQVVRAAEKFPAHQIVFKVHPRERPAHYSTLLGRLGAHQVSVVQKIDLNALLKASALVVTGFSTVALEAMIFERPVLIINLTGEPDPVDYVSSGAALGAYTPEEVFKQMDRLLTDAHVREALAQARQKYVIDQLFSTDGHAAQRVADLIQQMSSADLSEAEGMQ